MLMKTNWQDWFCTQLRASADGLVWAVEQCAGQTAVDWQAALAFYDTQAPDWHLRHVIQYERRLALPAMKTWLGAPLPPVGDWEAEVWERDGSQDLDDLIRDFRAVRGQQMTLLPQFSNEDWEMCRPVYWGVESLSTVLTRTYQHTLAHTDTLLRLFLWSQMGSKYRRVRHE